MSISVQQFWKLLVQSDLADAARATEWAAAFAKTEHGSNGSAKHAAAWLIGERRISKYQAEILLAGRPGPFVYGAYSIYDRIDTGRLAGIFRALHTESRHPVCLYFLSGAAANDAEVLARLAEQAEITNRVSLGHPHLLRCYELADEKAYKFIVIEDLQGRRVERLLATKGALPPADACRIARQAAVALGRLHAMGQVHGDIRPANLWLHADGNAKLVLFPLLRDPLAPPDAAADKGGRVPPEADYRAPELSEPNRAPDARSDIYSLGCTLYTMLANQPPFPGGDAAQKQARHQTEKLVPLDKLNPALPAALNKLVGYMMAKDPELRYQQANSVVEALLPHLAPDDAQTKPRPTSRRAQAYEAWLAKKTATAAAAGNGSGKTAAVATAAVSATVAAPAAPAAVPAAVAAPAAKPVPAAVAVGVATAVPAVAVPAGVAVAAATAIPAAVAVPAAAPLQSVPTAAMAMPVGAPMQTGFGAASALDAVTSVAASEEPFSSRPRRRRSNSGAIVMAGIVLMLLVGGGGAAWYFRDQFMPPEIAATGDHNTSGTVGDFSAAGHKPDGKTEGSTGTDKEKEEPPPPPEVPKDAIWALDDGMWDSPTKGKPWELKYLAPGAQAVIAIRPAEIVKQPESERLLDPRVLGTLADWFRQQLPALAGSPLDNIERAIIGLLPAGADGVPRLAVVLNLTTAVPEADLLKSWGDPTPEVFGEQTVYHKEDRSYWAPKADEGRVIVVGPSAEMREVVDGAAALVPLQIQFLLKSSDADRHFTCVVGPNLLAPDDKTLYPGVAGRLQNAVLWFLTGAEPDQPDAPTAGTTEPKGALVSGHLNGEAFFVELRLFEAESGPDKLDGAQGFHDRLQKLYKRVLAGVKALDWTPFSEKVLIDFPEEVAAVAPLTRVGAMDKQIVLRAYLPAGAADHLALGTYLCLLEQPHGMALAQAQPAASEVPKTAAQALQKKITLSFPRNTLEVSMQLLSEEIKIPITIIGTDLQLDGITKNQSFGLEERDQMAGDILRKIMLQANPDGKLVYVFRPKEGGGEEIFITTRAQVAKRGEKLPPELEKAPEKKK
jgi:eukaryotic-like serine/threonine-protein kinase